MIPEHEWLAQAKRLAIGMSLRIRHRHENRMNMKIVNDTDRWWCYCQRCHEGGVVMKEHVILGDHKTPADVDVRLPTDMVLLKGSEYEIPVARYLVSKEMALTYLPESELYYSPSRKRLMLQVEQKWHGRDVTGRSPQKWMNYNNAQIVGQPGARACVVVEDLFSMYKVRWAVRKHPDIFVMCALGTQCKDELVRSLLLWHPDLTLWFFDADNAGDVGATDAMRRMRAFAGEHCRIRPPEGDDPKDMQCLAIEALICNALDRRES